MIMRNCNYLPGSTMSFPSPSAAQVARNAVEELLLPSVPPVILLKIAREIAADIRPVEDILKLHGISDEQWEHLQTEPRFLNLLRSAVIEWQAVGNTADRVRVKTLAFTEEALPELYARLHDPKEPLSAKVELFKTIAKIGGVGERAGDAGGGQRMIVTINLGADHQLSFTKDITPTVQLLPDEVTEEDML
jgi:hypothetical protein